MVSAVEIYGDKSCYNVFSSYYACYNSEGVFEKIFPSYDAMNTYYVPPLEETYFPPVTYVYGAPTDTLSGSLN